MVQVDLGSIPVNPPVAALPGDTWYFQCWHRDGMSNNFSNALKATFN